MINLGVGLPRQAPEHTEEIDTHPASGQTQMNGIPREDSHDEDALGANVPAIRRGQNVQHIDTNGNTNDDNIREVDHQVNGDTEAEMTERDDGQLLSVVVEELETRFTAHQREELLRVLTEVIGQG